jgi:DNA gyrase subunit A
VGLIAISLREDDDLISVKLTDGNQEIIMGTSQGMSIRFPEQDVRSMGRSATGVKGIQLDEEDKVIGMEIVQTENDVLIVTSKGYGKRTPVNEYRIQSRGGKGIKTLNVTEKNGTIVGLKIVENDEDLMIMTASGTMIRTSMEGISTMGRNTQGVKLIHIREDDAVSTVTRVARNEEEEQDLEEQDGENGAEE